MINITSQLLYVFCRYLVASHMTIRSATVPEGLHDTKVQCSCRDTVPSLLYRYPVHHWEVGAGCQQHGLPHFITPTLCCYSPPLRWSYSSPGSMSCAYHRQTRGWQGRLPIDQVIRLDCYPFSIVWRLLIKPIGLDSSPPVCIFSYVYTCTLTDVSVSVQVEMGFQACSHH